MNPITIITIVVVALLTVVIFGLTWLAYGSCLKAYKIEVNQGKHDDSIVREYRTKKRTKGGLIGIICSYLALSALLGLFVTGVVYKASGENFHINNRTALVIKSESMSGYFEIGDICIFEKLSKDTELDKGEVYGYKYKDIIVTHRLVDITEEGLCEFKGDNNPTVDPYYVKPENVQYHYIGKKVRGIGVFILYAQSYFGLWSLIGVLGVAVGSEIVYRKLDKINKERNKAIPFYIPPEERKRGKQDEK